MAEIRRARATSLRVALAAAVLAAGAATTSLASRASGDASGPGMWAALAPVPGDARQETSFVRVGSAFVLAGGSARQDVYDASTGTWRRAADLPDALDHIQGAAVGGKVYYLGGLDLAVGWPNGAVGTVRIFDPATDTVTSGAPMPTGRERGAGGVAVLDGLIYYAGGLHGGAAVPWFDVYDPVANRWTSLPDLPTRRDHFHAVAVGRRIYAIGGRDQAIDATTGVNEAFDVDAGRWITGLAPLPTPRGGFAAARTNDEIVVLGGEGGGSVHAAVEAYRPASNTWRRLADMPTPRHGTQAASCGGGIALAGGGIQQGHLPTVTHDVLFPAGTQSACAPSPPSCRDLDVATSPGRPIAAALPCSDSDGDAIAFLITRPPSHGTVGSATGGAGRPDAAGRVVYSPNPGFAGTDSFAFAATDGVATPSTVRITVAAARPPAAAVPASAPARAVRVRARIRPDRRGRIRIRIACPPQRRRACPVTLSLASAAAFRTTGGTRTRIALGRGSASISRGASAVATINLSRAALRLLDRHPWVTARLVVATRRAGRRSQTIVLAARRPSTRRQYAPRPDSTAGTVANRISVSRANDHPATYW